MRHTLCVCKTRLIITGEEAIQGAGGGARWNSPEQSFGPNVTCSPNVTCEGQKDQCVSITPVNPYWAARGKVNQQVKSIEDEWCYSTTGHCCHSIMYQCTEIPFAIANTAHSVEAKGFKMCITGVMVCCYLEAKS
jgi:hypothetical protein